MSLKSKKFERGGIASGSAENLSAKRPCSAKSNRPSSADPSKYSARSNASMDSDLSDFLSVTGTSNVLKKSGHHKRSGSAGIVRSQHNEVHVSGSDSDSARTSSSSGARRKNVNKKPIPPARFSEDHIPHIMSQAKARTKPKLATTFQRHSNAATASPNALPDRPLATTHQRVQPDEVDEWWLSASDPAPVPPLFLQSPTELDKKHNWWPGASKTSNHVDEDFFQIDINNLRPGNSGLDQNNLELNIFEGEARIKLDKSTARREDVPKLFLDDLVEDDGDRKRQKAAVNIQRWFRGWKSRKQLGGQNAVKQLLSQKKMEKEKQMVSDYALVQTEDQREEEKRKRREEKARLARQAAIEELQKKREEKRHENQRKAEEELVFLQASGKVVKKKLAIPGSAMKSKPKGKKSTGVGASNNAVKNNEQVNPSEITSRPGTASSVGRKVDELFQESRESQVSAAAATSDEQATGALFSDRTDDTDKTLKSSQVGGESKTTFDDLLESLKQLEEEPADLLQVGHSSGPKFGGWGQNLEGDEDKAYLSHASLGQLNKDKLESQGQAGSALSAEKLRSILTFLDEVEKAEDDAISEISQARDGAISRGLPSSSTSASVAADREKEEAALESAAAAASDVTTAMMAVKIELEEKKRTNDLLQRALNQQREFTLRQAKEMEKDAKQRLAIQRQEYEAAIQRHLSFIDQLIDDKKVLGERCEEVVNKLKSTDKKYGDKVKQMEENHQIELKKQKEVILAAEKLRREKWINEKTQQIKEVTVKGLEPDIQKLIAKHKAEVKKIKSTHQAELLEADERAGRRYIQQIEELRDQLEREKENACARERELSQQRYEKQLEQEEQAYQQQRRRLYAEVQEEKERVALQGQKQRQELDEARSALEESHKKSILEMQTSHQRAMDDQERKHQLEMNELKERLEIEKQGWIENYMKKQDAVLMTKERELKEAVREGRDREIEMVISRLEEETSLAREECERAAENRIKRVRDKYESELKELEESERNMQEKYNNMKGRLSEVEGENARLKSILKQKDEEVEGIDKVAKRLQEERGKVADIIRQEFADRLVTTDEDNKRLKTEVSEMKARHRLEIDRVTREKEQEMEEVHKRVRQAIAKKEETMKTLREQHQAAMKRAEHLEFLLQEQRKKLLS
ncbi:centrosomal protein of 131 kDa-like [Stylophora pistillata]|uniref:Centrosomal protein of 131 kDa n=1 Tax=Stylophora pistillata TaxID=50429 RepID=A0A2B4SQ24_STYPI|nr:centrosomal protein of 131 kDa-like [Stylophora pistillata]PFX32011.1 Centrosomal protein of 131 kDa [Stylophora pistillata]